MFRKCVLMLTLVMFAATAQGSLVAYYSFDNAAALNADDSGNGANLYNFWDAEPPTATTGQVGGAALFDGDMDGYNTRLSYTSPPIYPSGAFSLSTWVKAGEGSAAGDCVTRPGASIGGGFAILIDGVTLRWYGVLYNGTGAAAINPGTAVTLNQWTHIALTFSPTSGPDGNGVYTGAATIYIDGVQKNSQEMTYKPDGYSFGLGSRPGGTAAFNGAIDEFAVFNDVLPGNAVAGLYNGAYTPLTVPEPCTLAFLAIGSVALLKRKKVN